MTTYTKYVDGVPVKMTAEEVAELEAARVPLPPPVPTYLTPNQARKALNRLGYRDAVDAYVATLSRDEQDDWEYATSIHRDNPIIAAGAAALGLSAEQVDDLFRMGATL